MMMLKLWIVGKDKLSKCKHTILSFTNLSDVSAYDQENLEDL